MWDALPLRKFLAGRERVYDCISVVVQEWPDDEFALAEVAMKDSGDRKKQSVVIKDLMLNVKRHLHLAYGEVEFGFIWTIILQALLWELIHLICEWWRKRSENRMALLKWQKQWRENEAS